MGVGTVVRSVNKVRVGCYDLIGGDAQQYGELHDVSDNKVAKIQCGRVLPKNIMDDKCKPVLGAASKCFPWLSPPLTDANIDLNLKSTDSPNNTHTAFATHCCKESKSAEVCAQASSPFRRPESTNCERDGEVSTLLILLLSYSNG